MTSSPEPSLASKATATPDKIRSALLRYRVMAWITGLWLLLLVVELVLKYGFDVAALDFVPIVHGWVYFVYLIMALDLAIKVRWPVGKAAFTLLAGTIPFLSFYVEHVRTREIKSQFSV
ncbi:DUF3817 domain-containing protein [Williamsia phyllosphaerae]|uniref:DUF3817 domain-containing protein n=1 Tax=Williamsia phyllosphaerae TaxID=885042 RepID=A0ABQ1V669_9NOCA|nr:DUF3817 domain-containing protein [Williamsia phyllosphaerae]GGF38381.1 hypothetical protein GCM10007298_37600 [Williamsia phyllosphaerae]